MIVVKLLHSDYEFRKIVNASCHDNDRIAEFYTLDQAKYECEIDSTCKAIRHRGCGNIKKTETSYSRCGFGSKLGIHKQDCIFKKIFEGMHFIIIFIENEIIFPKNGIGTIIHISFLQKKSYETRQHHQVQVIKKTRKRLMNVLKPKKNTLKKSYFCSL